MIVGGYTLHLYCDNPEHKGFRLDSGRAVVRLPDGKIEDLQDEFAGETRRECIRYAKGAGWVFGKGGVVTCPYCIERRKGAKR